MTIIATRAYVGLIFLPMTVLLIGCDKISDELGFPGTTAAYTKCLEDNKQQSEIFNNITSLCRAKHSGMFILRPPEYEAVGTYEASTNSVVIAFARSITNKSSDRIITAVKLSVAHTDNRRASGASIREKHTIDDLWVKPGETGYFWITDLVFVPAADRLRDGQNFFFTNGT